MTKPIRFIFEVAHPDVRDLFEAAQASLQRFGVTELADSPTAPPDRRRPDGFLDLFNAIGGKTRYAAIARRQINAANISAAITRAKDIAAEFAAKPLLLTDYLSEALSERLRSEGVAHLDRAGNACLTDPPVFIWLRGAKAVHPPTRPARAFQASGLRLIALLLAEPEALGWPYRKIADEAGLSLGSTSRILSDLRSLGFIRLIGPDRSTLVNHRNLFEHWEFGYHSRLRPRLKPLTFRSAGNVPLEQLTGLLPPPLRRDVLIGGELAAAIATRYLRPQSVALHPPKDCPLAHLIQKLRLLPDRHGQITLIEQLSESSVWRWAEFGHANLAHPLLIHAELLSGHVDDRLRETARRLFDQWLRPSIHDEPSNH